MKAFRTTLVLGLSALALAGCSPSAPESSAPTTTQTKLKLEDGLKATVKSVESGNTVTMDIEGTTKQVRLLNVVAPSENNNVPSGSCLVEESKEFLTSQLPEGTEVTLDFDKVQVGTSGYVDAAVKVKDELVNAAVVGEGLAATTFATPDDEFYPQVSEAQQKAAEEGKGLYSKDVDCTIPYEIEKQIKEVDKAGEIKDENERKAAYQTISAYYHNLVETQQAPASYVGSMTTLDSLREQIRALREKLGDNFYDEHGMSKVDRESASATARPSSK